MHAQIVMEARSSRFQARVVADAARAAECLGLAVIHIRSGWLRIDHRLTVRGRRDVLATWVRLVHAKWPLIFDPADPGLRWAYGREFDDMFHRVCAYLSATRTTAGHPAGGNTTRKA